MQDIIHKDGTDLEHRKLWRAVIIQAIKDACGVSDGGMAPSNSVRVVAKKWLTNRSKDLFLVCELAQISPDVVMAAGHALEKRGWSLPKRFFGSPTKFGLNLGAVLLRTRAEGN